jgi:hypothetical protein
VSYFFSFCHCFSYTIQVSFHLGNPYYCMYIHASFCRIVDSQSWA